MWSGDTTHSQGGSYPTQWALNPSAYMNVPNEQGFQKLAQENHLQVDWATLAQQWIKMKEGLPPVEKEEGEAPMEITKEDGGTTETTEEQPSTSQQNWPSSTPAIDGVWSNNWGWDQGGGWCWGGIGPGGDGKAGSSYSSGYTSVPEPPTVSHSQGASQPPYSYTAQPTNSHHYSNNPGYWTGDSDLKESWDNQTTRVHRKQTSVTEPIAELDSTKRKQLPAWIREGLEKMEREKQKKAESERLERERHEQLSKQMIEKEEKKSLGESNGSPVVPKKSKFETDSDESETEKESTSSSREKGSEKAHRTRFDWKGPESSPPPRHVHRSKEEILQHVMVQVRKILTQLLTEVTSEEIMAVCEQVHNQYQRKAPATTVRKTPALASLTGKLGLGIYDSDSSSESSGEGEGATGADSDQELRERIRRRKEEFKETELQIEREIAEQEEKERRVLLGRQSVSREGSADTEEQVQPTQQGAAIEMERKLSRDSIEVKSNESRELKHDIREKHELKKDSEKPLKKIERKSHKLSSESSSSSDYSRSPSPYRRRKHGRHRKEKRTRRSRSKSRSRSRSRSRERRKEHRRKDRRYRSRSSSRGRRRRSSERRGRHRSSSSSSGGTHTKRSSHRR